MKVAMPGYLRFPYKSWIPLVGMVLSNNRLTVGNSCRDSFLKIPGFFLFVPHSWFDRSCTFGCRNRTARLNENKQVWLVRRSSLTFVSTCRPLTLSTNALAQGFFFLHEFVLTQITYQKLYTIIPHNIQTKYS